MQPRGQEMAPRVGSGFGLATASQAKQDPGPGLLSQVCESNKSEASKQASLARPGAGWRAVPREEWIGRA